VTRGLIVIEVDLAPGVAPFRLLIVSSADVSRGPAVQRVLRTHLRTRQAEGAIVLSSAGVLARTGDGMHPYTARALGEVSVDPRGHTAHRLTERRLAMADLVLTASRDQRRPVIERRGDLRARTFTVVEFARLASCLDSLPAAPEHLIAALGEIRAGVRPVAPGEDDLEDPATGTFRDHERVVRRIDHAVRDVSRALAASLRTPVAGMA
jgi:protein-tyrosine phosphatase